MSSLVALAYLFSGVCFIMAIRGLASPETARQGNLFGIGRHGGCHRYHMPAAGNAIVALVYCSRNCAGRI